MTVLIALAGVSVLTWTLRRFYYRTPPLVPQAIRGLRRLIAWAERKAGGYNEPREEIA